MSKNIDQIFIANPVTTNLSTDLIHVGRSPYGTGDDAAITFANFAAQFGTPITPGALTEINDTNVTLTLGGSPSDALLQSVSISAGWAGQLSLSRGGSNANLTASAGSVVYSTASAMAFSAVGSSGQLLQSTGTTAPAWTTATYPSTAGTSGNILTSDGTNWNSTTPGAVGSVTSISAGTGITLTPNPITTTGSVALTIPVTEIHGGTNQTTYTLGDILYSSSANTLSKLAGNTTAAIQYLAQTGTGTVSAAPAWTTISGSDITGAALTKTDDTNVTMTLGGTPATALLRAASLTLGWTGQLSVPRGGSGNSTFTAYSVLCAGTTATGAFQNVSGLGSSGNVLTSQGAGTLPQWAAPAASSVTFTGDSGTPFSGNAVTVTGGTTGLTFAASTPDLTLGGIANLLHGGTNAALTASNGGIFYSTASAGAILAGTATANQILMSGASTTPAWSSAVYPATTTINQILYSTNNNNIGGLATANDGVLVTSNTGVPSFLANSGTAGFVLTANSGAPPSWQATTGSATSVIVNDVSTNATMYPVWVTADTGSLPLKVSEPNLAWNPSTSALTIAGSINGLTGAISAPTAIQSSAAANMLTFTYVGSAVNYINMTNNSTGSGPNINATGSDAAVALSLSSKGGDVQIYDATLTNSGIFTLKNAANTFGVGITAPSAQASNISFTLPGADGSVNQSIVTNGSGILSFKGGNPVVQRVNIQTGAVATGTTTIPYDDTIPQITEGTEFMTLAITPKNASNILRIEVIINVAVSVAIGNGVIAALFQDATANALAAVASLDVSASAPVQLAMSYTMSAGTTSSTTFRVRAGCNAAATTTFNGSGGARVFGGVMNSTITITEYTS